MQHETKWICVKVPWVFTLLHTQMCWMKVFIVIWSMLWVTLLTCSESYTYICSYSKGCVYDGAVKSVITVLNKFIEFVICLFLFICVVVWRTEHKSTAKQSGGRDECASCCTVSLPLSLSICLSVSLSPLLFCPWICCGSVVWAWWTDWCGKYGPCSNAVI